MLRRKINWPALEDDIRSVLCDTNFEPSDALRCIDEILANYTGRGNSIPFDLPDYEQKRLRNCYPRYFEKES